MTTDAAGPREQAIREQAERLANEFMDDGSPSGPDEYRTVGRQQIISLLYGVLDALRPEEPPSPSVETCTCRHDSDCIVHGSQTRLSSRWQELFWALPSGEMRSKLRALEIDIGRKLAGVASLRAQLTQAQQARDQLQEWKDVIIDATVVDWIFTKEHETNPRKAINDLLAWQVKLALDPAVSKEAHDLVQRAEAAEATLASLRMKLQPLLTAQGQIIPVFNDEMLSASWVREVVDAALAGAGPTPTHEPTCLCAWTNDKKGHRRIAAHRECPVHHKVTLSQEPT